METISGIYKIENMINGKVYIGSAVNIARRRNTHLSTLKHNKHENIILQQAYNKYGSEAFKFEILEIITDKSLLIIREQYYLNLYRCFKKKYGYNICPNAYSSLGVPCPYKGIPRTEEVKEKIRQSLFLMNNGKTVSDETRKKMSDSGKGKSQSKEHIKKRINVRGKHSEAKLVLNTQTGIYYDCGPDAADSENINHSTLRGRLNGWLKNNTPFIYA